MANPDDVCNWIEQLIVAQGPLAGQPISLMPWQREFIGGLLRPEVQTAALTIARANGKSALVGALAAAALVGPLAVPGADVVIVATSLGQARIAFGHAAAFLAPRIESEGRKVWTSTQSPAVSEIGYKPYRSRLAAKSSDPDTNHGLAPSMVLCDEPAKWKHGRSESLLASFDTATGKIGDEKIIALGTRPSNPRHWFSEWLSGDADYALSFAYEGEEGADMFTWDAALQANPSLPYLPALWPALEKHIARIRRTSRPRYIASWRSLRLNMGVDEVERAALLDAQEWRDCEVGLGTAPMRSGPSVWGVDLGGTAAMSAVAAYWPLTGWLEVLAALPGEPDLAARGDADAVGDLYLQMEQRGELATCAGRTVNVGEFLWLAGERWGRPDCVVSDRWREGELVDAMNAGGLPRAAWMPRGQGYKDGSEDIRYFERAVAEGHVRTPVSLLMRYAIGGCVTVQNDAGGRKIAKGSDGMRVAKHRDDAAVAAVMAIAEGRRAYEGLSGDDVSRNAEAVASPDVDDLVII